MKEDQMFKIHSVEIDWGGRPLRLETGKIARSGRRRRACHLRRDRGVATVVAAKTAREGVDFLPLTVDYIEKTYAAGRIPAATSSVKAGPPRRKRWFPA